MTGGGGPSDARLVERVVDGDREAFAQVYERYADRLFDFAYGMLRNREDAADAVADSFVTMAERLSQLRDPSRLRPWLYAVVRRECLGRLKARTRVAFGADDHLDTLPDLAPSPEDEAETRALRTLVWEAAAGLGQRDRDLLDLHLRHGLDGQELAEAMGITAGNAYTSLSRLRAQLERSLGALLIARLGRDDCTELGAILQGWDGTFSVLLRKRVARHVDHCLACDERRSALSPLSLVGGIPLLSAPSSLRDRVLGDSRLVGYFTDSAPAGPGTRAPAGAGPRVPAAAGVRRQRLAAVLPALAAALMVVALVIWGLSGRDPVTGPASEVSSTPDALPTLDTGVSPSPSLSVLPTPDPLAPAPSAPAPEVAAPTTPAATPTPPASPPPAPDELVVTPPVIDLGEVARVGTVSLTNVGNEPVTYAVSTPDSWVLPPRGGTLEAGASVTLSVLVDRTAVPAGPSEGRVVIEWAGGSTTLSVRATGPADPTSGPSLTTG